MMPMLALLLHDDGMDIIYFWSSIVIVTLPLIVFGGLTYFVVKASLKQQREAGSGEHGAGRTEQRTSP